MTVPIDPNRKVDLMKAGDLVRVSRLVQAPAAEPKKPTKRGRRQPREEIPVQDAILAPDIRRARGDVELEPYAIIGASGSVLGKGRRDRVQSWLARYRNRNEITDRQFIAGTRFGEDFEDSLPDIRSCLNDERGGGDVHSYARAVGGAAADARKRHMKARDALGELAGIVTWVAIFGHPASAWAEARKEQGRVGLGVLRLALDTLAKHYKLDGE